MAREAMESLPPLPPLPPLINQRRRRRLLSWATAIALFGALGCRDYARFDFRAGTDGVIRLLEVNPNSSWCWDGKMAIMAGVAGMSYPGMLQAILDCAWRRTQ